MTPFEKRLQRLETIYFPKLNGITWEEYTNHIAFREKYPDPHAALLSGQLCDYHFLQQSKVILENEAKRKASEVAAHNKTHDFDTPRAEEQKKGSPCPV